MTTQCVFSSSGVALVNLFQPSWFTRQVMPWEVLPQMSFSFKVQWKDSETNARTGELTTPHGIVTTPAFIPVGTAGSVKSLTTEDLKDLGAEIILANAYHLYLRPGDALIKEHGGLHKFTHWSGPILTDSGGFQVLSLAARRKITEEGVLFRSHLDGSEHFFSPEVTTRVQENIGADIIMCLDECTPYPASREYVANSMRRTVRWAERCKKSIGRNDQALFAIVQGGVFADLRRECAELLQDIGFPGYAIGSLSVGEPKAETFRIIEEVNPHLPENQPRYLMGMGTPSDLIEAVTHGVDLFDCVLPTRNARNGMLFTSSGKIQIKNKQYATDREPIDSQCTCYVCKNYSRAYLRHLFVNRELLAYRLNTVHNLFFYEDLMRKIRRSIKEKTFGELKRNFQTIWGNR